MSVHHHWVCYHIAIIVLILGTTKQTYLTQFTQSEWALGISEYCLQEIVSNSRTDFFSHAATSTDLNQLMDYIEISKMDSDIQSFIIISIQTRM